VREREREREREEMTLSSENTYQRLHLQITFNHTDYLAMHACFRRTIPGSQE
jgi:hypothetical protein